MIIKVKFVREDSGFCREYYKCVDSNRYFIKQEEYRENFTWYTTDRIDGEPGFPVSSEKFQVVIPPPQKPTKDERFRYMLLDRYRSDVHYFLGWGKRGSNALPDPKGHIEAMKELYNSFSEDKKPQWISLEEINEYERIIFETNELPYY